MTTSLETLFGPDGLQLALREQTADPDTSHKFLVTLPPGRVERALTEAHLLLQTFGTPNGTVPSHVRWHYEETSPRATCPCCKLLGRVLTAQGRRAPSEQEMRRANIKVVRPGVTGEGLAKAEADRAKREADRAARQPKLATKVTPNDAADLF